MSLQKIVEEINKLKPFATEDVESGPSQTLNARRGRKNNAIETIKRLKRDYRQELLKSSVFIISTGSDADGFAKTAKEGFGVFSANPDQFYEDLAKRIPPTLYMGKEAISNTFDVLVRHLEDKMNELEVGEYNQLIFKGSYARKVSSREEFTQLVKTAINSQVGTEIVAIQAAQSLVNTALEKNHIDKVTPIVLSTNDENFVMDLLADLNNITSKIYIVASGEISENIKALEGVILAKDSSKESVKNAMKEVKKRIKGG